MVVSSYVVLVTTTKLGMKEVEICGGVDGFALATAKTPLQISTSYYTTWLCNSSLLPITNNNKLQQQ